MRTLGSQGLDKISPTLKFCQVISEINCCIYLFTSDPGKAIILNLTFLGLEGATTKIQQSLWLYIYIYIKVAIK